MSLTRLTAHDTLHVHTHGTCTRTHNTNSKMRTQSHTINYLLLANPAGESACDARHLLLPLLLLYDCGCL